MVFPKKTQLGCQVKQITKIKTKKIFNFFFLIPWQISDRSTQRVKKKKPPLSIPTNPFFVAFNLPCMILMQLFVSLLMPLLPLPPKVKEVMFSSLCVCLFVCSCTGYLKKLWTDLDEMLWMGWVCDKDEMIRCW